MFFLKKLSIAVVFILSVTIFAPTVLFAQSSISCTDVSNLSQKSESDLKAYLAQCEKEIAEQQAQLDTQTKQSKTITGDITVLSTKINKAKLDIKARNAVIAKLSKDIGSKKQKIGQLELTLEDKKDSLAQLIRKTLELDQSTFAYLLLSGKKLSDFYSDIDSFAYINKAVKESVDEIKGVKTETEAQKSLLEKDQNSQVDAKVEVENTKKKIEQTEAEKKQLLSISKQKESAYKVYIAEKAKKAAQIRTALFSLRDSAAIPFEDALKYANAASAKTGVRPAFVLAILTQESALGKNVGSCYLTDQTTGSGIGARSGTVINKVMKPSRDVEPFIALLEQLGRQVYKTLVSCPQSIGYGGAMGPAQFIPSTWALFAGRIANAVGKSIADPWDPQDAFMASSIYLSDLGAGTGGYTAERNAACKYYSGKTCAAASYVAPYGDQVMVKAKTIQDNIDFLQGA
jgi:peptidoglycan hydrolase CwlO-like protein